MIFPAFVSALSAVDFALFAVDFALLVALLAGERAIHALEQSFVYSGEISAGGH